MPGQPIWQCCCHCSSLCLQQTKAQGDTCREIWGAAATDHLSHCHFTMLRHPVTRGSHQAAMCKAQNESGWVLPQVCCHLPEVCHRWSHTNMLPWLQVESESDWVAILPLTSLCFPFKQFLLTKQEMQDTSFWCIPVLQSQKEGQ